MDTTKGFKKMENIQDKITNQIKIKQIGPLTVKI